MIGRSKRKRAAVLGFLRRVGVDPSELDGTGAAFAGVDGSWERYDEIRGTYFYDGVFDACSDPADVDWVCRWVLGMTDTYD